MNINDINQILLDQINVLAKTQQQVYEQEDYNTVIDIAETITIIAANIREG